jgi:SAM-dependent methyltransferase
VSLLDVLEHCPDDHAMLCEMHRVLRVGGILVLTVPARHAFSWLDPDDVKLRFPRLHRRLYSLRFGRAMYEERFRDRGDGLFGDVSRGARRHTNYARERLAQCLEEVGLEVVDWAGANLFWRLLPVPELLPDGPARRLVEQAILLDGRVFSRANLFLTARRFE